MTESRARDLLEANQLSIYIAISFVLHLLILGIAGGPQVEATLREMPALPRTIEVTLNATSRAPEQLVISPDMAQRPAPQNKSATSPFPAIPDDSGPELLSEIAPYISFPITPGFMVIRLSINEAGEVEESEVIYSELSRQASKLIAKRFAEASYKPALKQGVPTKDNLILKVNIEH